MKGEHERLVGGALMLLGLVALLGNAGAFGLLPAFIRVIGLFAAGALLWLWGRQRLPFAARLLGYIALGIVATATAGPFGGTAATGFIAMAFMLVFLADSRQWWALIPGGVMSGVCLVTLIETLFPRWDAGPLFLLALAGTFTWLYMLPRDRGGQPWALYPAVVLIFITVLANDPSGRTPPWLMPGLLIGLGAGLLWWWRRHEG